MLIRLLLWLGVLVEVPAPPVPALPPPPAAPTSLEVDNWHRVSAEQMRLAAVDLRLGVALGTSTRYGRLPVKGIQ